MAMRPLLLVLVSCVLAAACAHGRAVVRMPHEANLVYRYYEVAGGSVGELTGALQAAAPETTPTGSFFAKTTWTVVWDGEWTADSTACRVIRSETRLESQMALPRWKITAASADLASDWNAFVRNLTLHEHGHVVNAVAASREVDSRLRNLERASCDGMETAARATIDSVVAVFRAQDEAYDQRTRHGEAQGAVWPPRASRNMRQPGPGDAFRNPPLNLPGSQP
jgi:predicted secreted Zn-dependent protease